MQYFIKNDYLALFVICLLHGIENTTAILERVLGGLLERKVLFEPRDKDSLQNFIGDNSSFFLGGLLAIHTPLLDWKILLVLLSFILPFLLFSG